MLMTALLPLLLCSCTPPVRTMELSIPLTAPMQPQTEAQSAPTKPVNALDVLVAIETVAADNGLQPYTDASGSEDILGLADIDGDANTLVRSWRHPDLPVFLTATRQKSEILVLLNYPAEAADNPAAQKLFKAVRTELAEKLAIFIKPADVSKP